MLTHLQLPKWLRYAALLMLVALIVPMLVACGDDGEDETPVTGQTPATGQTTPATGTTPEADETETPDTGTPDTGTPVTGVGTPTTQTGTAGTPGAGTPGAGTPGTGMGTGRVEGGDLTFGMEIEEAENEGGTFIEGSFADISSLMPITSSDSASFDVQSLIFESIVTINPNNLQPVGLLAEAWELADDGVTWTFYLRDGITWHDGEPFTAEDVAFTYNTHMDPNSGSQYTSDITSKIASVEVIDDLTVQFVATGPQPDFLVDTMIYGIVAEHIWADVDPAAIATDPGATGQDPSRVVGTGPFMFESWTTGDNVRLVRNENYWQGAPHLDAYVYRVVLDQAAGTAQLRTGEIDLFQGVQESEVESLRNTPGIIVEAVPRLSFTWYGLNLDPEKTPLFQDVEVRQALLYAVDREALVEEIRFGFGEVAHGVYPPMSWVYAPDELEIRYDYDPERARELLEQAGWTDTNGNGIVDKDGMELSFTMYTNAGNNVRESYLVALQEMWAQIGVEMQPEFIPFPDLVDRLTTTHDFEAVLLGFGMGVGPDVSTFFGCDYYENGLNSVRYCNEEVDALLEAALVELDQETRRQMYIDMVNIVNEELPLAILDFPQLPIGYSARVHNLYPSDINMYWNVHTWWVEE